MRLTWFFAMFTAGFATTTPAAPRVMDAREQNAVIQKYCAVCHSDAIMAGGFSLQHFDSAHADPTMAAMLISKLTSGLSLKEVAASRSDEAASAAVLDIMKSGAMGAAGRAVPDRETQDALLSALSREAAAAAREWTVVEGRDPATNAPMFTASIVREAPSSARAGVTDIFRIALTCRSDTREAEALLAWANGVPEEGRTFSVAVDGKAPFAFKAEGGKKQGNGNNGPGSAILAEFAALTTLPMKTLTVSDVFPKETVVFPFDELPAASRQALAACFAGNTASQ